MILPEKRSLVSTLHHERLSSEFAYNEYITLLCHAGKLAIFSVLRNCRQEENALKPNLLRLNFIFGHMYYSQKALHEKLVLIL